MSYPVDQLTALGRANFNLALKLVDVARISGQESFQLGTKALSGFAEDARSAIGRAAGKAETAPAAASDAISDKAAAAFSDAEKVRDHAIATTKAAFDEWQQAVKDVTALPAGTAAADGLTALFKPWFGATPPAADAKPQQG